MTTSLPLSTLEILHYDERYKGDFEALNREWLEKDFTVEPIDEKYFRNPKKEIIEKGGFILFARLNDKIVGTCSLIRDGTRFELAKMGVTHSVRGKGVGSALVEACLNIASDHEATAVYLLTNTLLTPAIKLYENFGFIKTFEGQSADYSRGNLEMELKLH